MYPIRTINWALLGVTEMPSGLARRVAIHATSGNAIPKTMSTTTASVASKPFICEAGKGADVKNQAADKDAVRGEML